MRTTASEIVERRRMRPTAMCRAGHARRRRRRRLARPPHVLASGRSRARDDRRASPCRRARPGLPARRLCGPAPAASQSSPRRPGRDRARRPRARRTRAARTHVARHTAGRKEESPNVPIHDARCRARVLRAERGQGTVEYVGIVLAVAALLVAVAAAIDNKVGGPIATALVHRLQEAVDPGRQREARLSRAGRGARERARPGRADRLLGDELGRGLRAREARAPIRRPAAATA